MERESVFASKPRQPRLFQADLIIIVEIIDADDVIPAREETLRNMHTDEPGSPSDYDFHAPTNKPASAADIRFARLPASSAFNPSLAIVAR